MTEPTPSGAITGRPPPLALLLFAALVVALASALYLAGRSGADPAEVDALTEKYTSSQNALGMPLSEEQARCRARVYLGSRLSDGALADVRAGREPRARSEQDVTELAALASRLAGCL